MKLSNVPIVRQLNINVECYANWRDNCIKNGGVIISWHGIRLAYIYAILSVEHSLVLVVRKGLLAKHYQSLMQLRLYEYLHKNDSSINGWNQIDTPFRH